MPETRVVTAAPGVNRRGVAMMSAAHVVDDIYQGVVPAMLPFLVAERQYTYAAVSGLVLAATVFSSVAQPLFGWWADRGSRRWLIAGGMLTAGAGIAVSGLTSSYELTWLALAVSGIGVAAFHPEAARAARKAAGSSTQAMSVFALGGNVGYALGPLLATPVLLLVGLEGTALLVLPAAVMAMVLVLRLGPVLDGTPNRPRRSSMPTGRDDWPAFGWLTGVVVVRSVLFFGMTTFLALYLLDELDATTGVAAAALTVFLLSGAAGTLLGGWVADRAGKITSIRVGFALALPALLGVVLAPNAEVAMACVVLTGVGVYMPFSVFVVLGQDYLPQRIGTASPTVTPLAVSAGGLASPLLGLVADATDLRTALMLLLAMPVVGLVLTTRMREPGTPPPSD
ncbi:MAG TPA: MFS transporter [Actinomycetales bacterium]|nr:MFS transporter [Actinomycetales bacterium]